MEEDAKVARSSDRNLSDVAHLLTRIILLTLLLGIAWGVDVIAFDTETPLRHWLMPWLLTLLISEVFLIGWWSRRYDPVFRPSALDRVILRSRTGLLEIDRVDLREELLFELRGVGSRTALRVLAGVTVTLSSLAREPMKVNWGVLPFPAKCGREDLIAAIIFSGGVSRRSAERLLEALSETINRQIAVASRNQVRAIELFPLGLYENITEDDATFSPQPIVLRRGYPDLSTVLASYEAKGGAG